MRIAFILACLTSLSAFAARAHEFWIDPEAFFLSGDENIVADIRVGQNFSGSAYPYIPNSTRLFAIAAGEKRAPVKMRIGDRPALDVPPLGTGLNVVLHVTRDYTVRYAEMEGFAAFVTHKDAAWALKRHVERGLPEADFVERYSRYAKSLVSVGDGAGSDRAFGLLTEIVALANPYTDDLSQGLPVQVLYQGAPRPGAQVEIFTREEGDSVTVTTVHADDEGIARVPVTPGTVVLLDSVVLREVNEEAPDKAVWESLWASLTFAVPDS